MSILRNQQIDEILDADNKINRQLFERIKTQVKQFAEEKKERNAMQITNDVNLDSNVERLLKILEEKYNAGETFLMSSFTYDSSNQKSLEKLLNNQEIITLYNKIVNLLNSSTLEESQKEALKLKILDLKPLIDSISYIMYSIIRVLDDPLTHPRLNIQPDFLINADGRRNYIMKFLPRIFTSYSTIRVIQKQLERNNIYTPITVEEINTEFNQFLNDYRVDNGADFIDDPDILNILNNSVKNKSIEDAKEKRIRQIEQETGKPLSQEEKNKLSNMFLKTPITTSNLSEAELKAIADSIYGIGEQMRVQRENRVMAGLPPEEIASEIPLEGQEIIGPITEKSAEKAREEFRKIADSIYKKFDDGFKKVQFPNVGAWNLATARNRARLIVDITRRIITYYLTSVNKTPPEDAVVDAENNGLLQTYPSLWSKIIDATDNAPLNGVSRATLKNELATLKRDYKDIVNDANRINEENFVEEFLKTREGQTQQQGEPFIFTGQGKPFLYNDENNDFYN